MVAFAAMLLLDPPFLVAEEVLVVALVGVRFVVGFLQRPGLTAGKAPQLPCL